VLAHAIGGHVPIDWWYWNASRVIHHPVTEPGPITEFPAFTYLYADLHAHAMALPYTAVALALALAFVRDESGGGETARLLLLSLLLGSLWVLNTWDLPVYALLALLALAVHSFRRGGFSIRDVGALAVRCLALLGLAYSLFLPFHRRYAGVFSGIDTWEGSRTRLNDYLTIHGLFLFAIASALLLDLWLARDAGPVARALRLGLRSWQRIGRFRDLHRLLVGGSTLYAAGIWAVLVVGISVVVLASLGYGVPALIAGLSGLTLLCLVRRRSRRSPSSRVRWQAALVLVLVGLLITLGVEFFVAKNIDVGRNNTVFKFYLQVWVLWGIAAAVCVHRVYERLPRLPRRLRTAWRLAFVALLASAAVYPILATRAKIGDRFNTSVGPTLDGMAFMDKAVYGDRGQYFPLAYDAAAIHWVLQTLPGSPVVGEVNTYPTLYGWGNRYAMFTGNPAVVGWDYHERQQRAADSDLVRQRIADIQSAYGTSDAKLAYEIFRRYGVSYFVVGPLERAYFPRGQDKWRTADGSLWRLVYRNPRVEIYRLLAA
jgi:YYY domain-containing protein